MFGKMNFIMIVLILGVIAVSGRPNESLKEKEAERILEKVETEMKDVEAKLALIGEEEIAEKKLLENKDDQDDMKDTQVQQQSLTPTEDLRPKIAHDFVETIDEIKKVEQELIKVEKNLGEVDVDFTKADTLLREGEKDVLAELPTSEDGDNAQPDQKGEDGHSFGRVDDIMAKVSNQMKSVLKCFENYMQCLKDTKHNSKVCHENLESDEFCHSGNVKI